MNFIFNILGAIFGFVFSFLRNLFSGILSFIGSVIGIFGTCSLGWALITGGGLVMPSITIIIAIAIIALAKTIGK